MDDDDADDNVDNENDDNDDDADDNVDDENDDNDDDADDNGEASVWQCTHRAATFSPLSSGGR